MCLTYLEDKRDFKPRVIWLWGESGVGKSKRALELCLEIDDTDWYRKGTGSGKWFPGYDAHKVLWLDDIKPEFFGREANTYNFLLELLDRYPCTIETKGSQRQLLARTIILTSLNHPRNIFEDSSNELMRRIDEVTNLH